MLLVDRFGRLITDALGRLLGQSCRARCCGARWVDFSTCDLPADECGNGQNGCISLRLDARTQSGDPVFYVNEPTAPPVYAVLPHRGRCYRITRNYYLATDGVPVRFNDGEPIGLGGQCERHSPPEGLVLRGNDCESAPCNGRLLAPMKPCGSGSLGQLGIIYVCPSIAQFTRRINRFDAATGQTFSACYCYSSAPMRTRQQALEAGFPVAVGGSYEIGPPLSSCCECLQGVCGWTPESDGGGCCCGGLFAARIDGTWRVRYSDEFGSNTRQYDVNNNVVTYVETSVRNGVTEVYTPEPWRIDAFPSCGNLANQNLAFGLAALFAANGGPLAGPPNARYTFSCTSAGVTESSRVTTTDQFGFTYTYETDIAGSQVSLGGNLEECSCADDGMATVSFVPEDPRGMMP